MRMIVGLLVALFVAVSPAGGPARAESMQPSLAELTDTITHLAREQAITSGNVEALRVEVGRLADSTNSLSLNIGDLVQAIGARERGEAERERNRFPR